MDLTTLITASTLTADAKIMHARTWHQSGGEPWAFSVSGQHHPQVLKSREGAVRATRDTQPDTVVIRVVLTGLPGTRSVTATMFTPCSNIALAARRIAQFAELRGTSTRSKEHPNQCSIAATTDRGSGRMTALPTGFWRQPPKATHPISRCQPGQEMTPAKSALQGVPHHPTRRWRRLHP